MSTTDELRAELADVDGQLRTLRGETGGLTEQTGGDGSGPQDEQDTAAALTNIEENEALIATLQARRDRLAAQLGD